MTAFETLLDTLVDRILLIVDGGWSVVNSIWWMVDGEKNMIAINYQQSTINYQPKSEISYE